MEAFIGHILKMGLVQVSDIKEYWSCHETLNMPFYRRKTVTYKYFEICMLVDQPNDPN